MITSRRAISDDDLWAPAADLMGVIMLIFMLIVMILFISYDLDKKSNIKKCEGTRQLLDNEFKQDFDKWGAVLKEDLTILFTNQRVLFEQNEREIESGGWFASMLEDFFPRYMKIVQSIRTKYGEKEILQIRIDGHTSSEYGDKNIDDAYMENMRLSQDRARNILDYVLSFPESVEYKWIARALITANGLSSSQLIVDGRNRENKEASRRVEFKMLTNSCQKAGVYDKNVHY